MPEVKLHILDTGYCRASEHHLIQGGRRMTIDCHATATLIEHPDMGTILFDTGYAPRIWNATRRLPFRIYRWITPLRVDPELAVVRQLRRFHLNADDVQYVFLSHFHADHVAGLRDFPNAGLIASKNGYEDVYIRRGLKALSRAFIPSLLPEDFRHRARLIDEFTGPSLDELGQGCDLFNDGTLVAIELPGHARGQMGLMVQTVNGPVLLAADGCFVSASFRECRPPHPTTHVFIDDTAAMRNTIRMLHDFHRTHPEVKIIPTHCPEVLKASA